VPTAEAVTEQKIVPLDRDVLLTARGLAINLGNFRQPIEETTGGS